MKKITTGFVFLALSLISFLSIANCCKGMGGIQYCDSSAGRFVCHNGYYSSCYCTDHAVMDLQKIAGCCLWHGGVLKQDEANGIVICNDGAVSATCTYQSCVKSQDAGSW